MLELDCLDSSKKRSQPVFLPLFETASHWAHNAGLKLIQHRVPAGLESDHLKIIHSPSSSCALVFLSFVFLFKNANLSVPQYTAPSADSRRAVVSYWRKYVHIVLVNRLGGLSLPRKSVVRLTDRPDMTLDVYR